MTELRQAVRNSFSRAGWAAPLLVITLFYIGRGWGNSALFLYTLWGLAALSPAILKAHSRLLLLWGLMLASFAASNLLIPTTPLWKETLVYSLSALILPFTLQATPQSPLHVQFRWAGWLPLLLLCLYWIKFARYASQPDFSPRTMMSGIQQAALFPLIFLLQNSLRPWHFWTLFSVTLSLCTITLAIGESRTELAVLITGLLTYATLRQHWYRSLLIAGTLAIVIAAGMMVSELLYDQLNRLSSQRWELWHWAMQHPPANLWFGTGMEQSQALIPATLPAQHLHNLLLELWYETGTIGLWLYLALFAALLWACSRARMLSSRMQQREIAVLLAACSGVLLAGLLDKSYLNALMRLLPLYLAATVYVRIRQWCPTPDTAAKFSSYRHSSGDESKVFIKSHETDNAPL